MIRIPLGRYVDTPSPVHELDPRGKLVCLITLAVISFFATDPWDFVLVYLTIASLMYLSNIPFKLYLRSLKGIMILVVLIVFFNAFFTHGEVLLHYGRIIITKEGLIDGTIYSLRLVAAVLFSAVLAHTTSPMSLSRALEFLMKKLGFTLKASQSTGMVFASAIRFVPVISEEAGRIWLAQKARGAPFESRNLLKRIKALTAVLVPLVVLSLRRAEEFDVALRLRGYDPSKKRTHLFELNWNIKTSLMLLASILIATAVIL